MLLALVLNANVPVQETKSIIDMMIKMVVINFFIVLLCADDTFALVMFLSQHNYF